MKESKYNTPALFLAVLVLLNLFFAFPGCKKDRDYLNGVPVKTVSVVGDISNPFRLGIQEVYTDTVWIDYKGRRTRAFLLKEIIARAEPWAEHYQILYRSHDGFGAVISGKGLDASFLAYSGEGWFAVNPDYPVSSNVRDLESIAVIAEDVPPEKGFTVIDAGKDNTALSPGRMYRDGYCLVPKIRGRAFLDKKNNESEAVSFITRRVPDISLYSDKTAVVFGEKGESVTLEGDSCFILNENSIGLMKDNEVLIPVCRGMVIGPPPRRITDVYIDARQSLINEEPLLILLLDGFGWHQYKYAIDSGLIPFLAGLPAPEKCMSVYPPITPVNLAASLTGELPPVNGVASRETTALNVPTIFNLCIREDKSCIAVIGPLSAVEFEIEPVFCLDLNKDQSTDDEKAEYALGELNKGHDLVFVHLKDIDRAGHRYGDLHYETMNTIGKIDRIAGQVVSSFTGRVLIYSDHGMHETRQGGGHGKLIEKDMFTPYWYFYREAGNE